jgi:hypothetical protein
MVALQGMKKERDKSSVGYIIAERYEQRAPVIANRGEKTDIEIRKGQHDIKSRREGGNSNLEERKGLGNECLTTIKCVVLHLYEYFARARAGGYSNNKETKMVEGGGYWTKHR